MLSRSHTSHDGVQTLSRIVMAAGVVAATSGVVAWMMVKSELTAERITVPPSGRRLPGRTVSGPFTALAEADTVERSALAATGGKTYAELGEDDPTAQMAMNASLLRSSLFTSVVAFGVAASQVALGGVLVLIGRALSKLGRRVPQAA